MKSNQSKPISTLFLLLPLLLLAGIGWTNVPYATVRFKNITIEQGLANNEVRGMVQDDDGFIWLGTGSGLDRFDGYSVKHFNPLLRHTYDRALLKSRPIRVCRDQQGRYFLGSDWAGLQMYDPQKDSMWHFTEEDGLISDAIVAMLVGSDTKIWIGTVRGLCSFDPDTKQFMPVEGLKGIYISDLKEDQHKTLWVATPIGLRAVKSNAKNTAVLPIMKVLHTLPIEGLTFDREGNMWLLHMNVVLRYDMVSQAIEQIYPAAKDEKKELNPMVIHVDGRGNIWIGTYGNGLLRLEAGSYKPYFFQKQINNPFSLLGNKIICLFEDRFQNLWISVEGEGISILNTNFNLFKIFQQAPNSPIEFGSNTVNDICTSQDGTTWIALPTGVTALFSESGTIKHFPLSTFYLKGAQIQKIAVDDKGGLFLGTSTGLWHWLPESQSVNRVLPSKLQFTAFKSLYYHDNTVYFSAEPEGLGQYDLQTKQFTFYKNNNQPNDLNEDHVWSILKARNGWLWVGSYKGLCVRKTEKHFFDIKNILPQACIGGGNTVPTIYEDTAGNIWYGRIDEGGLQVYNPKTGAYRCFDTDDGLPNNSVTAILQDAQGYFWIGTYLGIARLKILENWADKTPSIQQVQQFSTQDGLPTNTIWLGAASADKQRLYFGTNSGLIEVISEQVLLDTVPPILVWTDFKLFNQSVSSNDATHLLDNDIQYTKTITLKPRQNVFTLEFAGLNYYSNEQNRYAYQLVGVHKGWINEGMVRQVTFSNLKAGTYQLLVRVKGNHSNWSAPRALAITVLPPFWQTSYFIILAILFTLVIAYIVYRIRMQQFLKVEVIRNRIAADLHDEVGTTLTNIEILAYLSTQQPQKNTIYLQKIIEAAQFSNEVLHQIVWSLKPENDQFEQITIKLIRHALETLEPLGITLSLDVPENLKDIKIQTEKRRDLFLVFKEVLTNICKHAKANSVHLTLVLNRHMLHLCICDNGIGIKTNDPSLIKGNGINNIRKRLTKWNGKFELSPKAEGGTCVNILLPIP